MTNSYQPIVEPLVVVPASAISRGQRFRWLWISGWIVGALVSLGSAQLVGQVVAYRKAHGELQEVKLEIERLQKEQLKVTAAFVKGWEDQRQGINLVTRWAEYIKERDDLGKFNKNNAPQELARRGRLP